MAKLLWERKPRFAVALVVRGLLIVTSHTNCDVTSCPVVRRRYANADGDEQRYKTMKLPNFNDRTMSPVSHTKLFPQAYLRCYQPIKAWLHHMDQDMVDILIQVSPGVGVTKPISSVPLFSHFCIIIKIPLTCWISRLYLTGVTAARLRWYLSNMNVIWII